MTETEKISVITDGKAIGTLAFYDERRTAFEYSQEWLEKKNTQYLSSEDDMAPVSIYDNIFRRTFSIRREKVRTS